MNFDGGIRCNRILFFNAYKSKVSPQRLIAIHVPIVDKFPMWDFV